MRSSTIVKSPRRSPVLEGITIVFLLFLIVVYSLSTGSNAEAVGAHQLGVTADEQSLMFRVYSSRATRVEVWLYGQPTGAEEAARVLMTKDSATSLWSATVSKSALQDQGITGTVYYGYRAWGPNWTYDALWTKGTETGFHQDVDEEGNRFNPNKLLLDPYALEVSHDPMTVQQDDGGIYASGESRRARDSGRWAPKGIVLAGVTPGDLGTKPTRPFKDEIIYEVHLRGFTKQDGSLPDSVRGTYQGAGLKAPYLKSIGVTAVEFLPVHELQNDRNDVAPSTDGDDSGAIPITISLRRIAGTPPTNHQEGRRVNGSKWSKPSTIKASRSISMSSTITQAKVDCGTETKTQRISFPTGDWTILPIMN